MPMGQGVEHAESRRIHRVRELVQQGCVAGVTGTKP
jgi:hypothetical protein